jgi:hypothetical protein
MSTGIDPPGSPAAGGPSQPSRCRAAALLAAAAPLAAVAPLAAAAVLAAAPLAAGGRDGTPSAMPPAAAVPSWGPCATTLTAGTHDTIKYPLCAGD